MKNNNSLYNKWIFMHQIKPRQICYIEFDSLSWSNQLYSSKICP